MLKIKKDGDYQRPGIYKKINVEFQTERVEHLSIRIKEVDLNTAEEKLLETIKKSYYFKNIQNGKFRKECKRSSCVRKKKNLKYVSFESQSKKRIEHKQK